MSDDSHAEEVAETRNADDPLGKLFEEAVDAVASLEERFEGVDSLHELEDVESALGDVEKLVRVADELEDVFETLDLSELGNAIDREELLESIHLGEIPDALAHEDEGLDDVVDVPHLVKAVNLLSAWDAADLGRLWEETRELEDAVDDLSGDEDGGLASRAASALAGDDGGGGLLEGAGDELREMDVDPKDALGSIDIQSDPEVYQTFIQQQATEGIDEFRDALLRVHGEFERLYELNREKMRTTDTSTNSRNPTAASTIPVDRRDLGGGARYSTVPRQVKYSTAPARRRIYGRRFELERKRQGYE